VTPAVVRASSGAAEHLRVAQVVNLVRALEQAKAAGIWVYGLEAVPEAPLYTEARLDGAVALVVGSEGQGLQRLVRDRCDGLVRLPMRGHVASLNAAVSAAIALYRIRALRDRSG
jgi:23S rRNA (guanosine2251-2'-O)-methyltransferase